MTLSKYTFVFCLLIVALLISACGSASSPPVAQPSATAPPHAAPLAMQTIPTAPIDPGELSANSFRFEVNGAGEDKIIDGGLVQYASASKSRGWALTEVGNFARYGTTLFTPLAIETGEHPLNPYSFDYVEGDSAASFIGAWFYKASAGTLLIEDVSNNTISGRFEFTAPREDDASQVVKVKGEFKRIRVPDNKRSAMEPASTVAEPIATPSTDPAPTAQPTSGEFWFGAASNNMDVFVGSGIIHSDLTFNGNEYSSALWEDGDPVQHVVTLFLPFDLKPGEITLKLYVAGANPIGPSALFSTGLDRYGATEGTLTLDEVSDDTITGSFVFKAASSSAAEKVVDVTGEFSGIALAKK